VAQVLSDVSPLAGKPINFERLISSKLVHEDEPFTHAPRPPSFPGGGQPHRRAPYLRLVSSRNSASAESDTLNLSADPLGTLLGFVYQPESVLERINKR